MHNESLTTAITVLREQTEINPFDDYAYNLLGRVYWRATELRGSGDSRFANRSK